MSSHLTAHRDGEGEKADIGKELWERGPYQSICIFQNVREGRKVIDLFHNLLLNGLILSCFFAVFNNLPLEHIL